VRINLTDTGKTRSGRRKGRRRRRSRTFDSSIALPQTPSRGLGTKPKPKGPAPETQTRKRRTSTRRSRARQRQEAVQPETIAPSHTPVRIPWRIVLRRMPVLLVLASLVGGIAYASTDARFFVYDAHIAGARHVAAETIYQAAGVHEQNIFWVRPQEVARRIIQIEGIKAVRVRCSLPAQVIVEVEEREPLVMWRAQTQERDWWLDEEGVILPYHGDVRSADTIFVVDSSERHLEVGGLIEPEGIVQSVQQLAAALPEIKVIFYEADRGLSFIHQVSGGEWPVYVGSSEDLGHKIQVVQTLTDYLMSHNIHPRYVDVRWADHPVFGKPRGE
jgi:cell division septal protein FtsQ